MIPFNFFILIIIYLITSHSFSLYPILILPVTQLTQKSPQKQMDILDWRQNPHIEYVQNVYEFEDLQGEIE
jgi:hypothetical protein